MSRSACLLVLLYENLMTQLRRTLLMPLHIASVNQSQAILQTATQAPHPDLWGARTLWLFSSSSRMKRSERKFTSHISTTLATLWLAGHQAFHHLGFFRAEYWGECCCFLRDSPPPITTPMDHQPFLNLCRDNYHFIRCFKPLQKRLETIAAQY